MKTTILLLYNNKRLMYKTSIALFSFIIILSTAACSQKKKSSINGEVFTPKGNLRALVIFAGFKGYDHDQEIENWPSDSELPLYVENGEYKDVFFTDVNQFENISENDRSISRLFYEMSNKEKPFRFMADVYKSRINIDPRGARKWGDMNVRVLEQMKKQDPNFDWIPYDQRKNRPNYEFDNSVTGPDGKPDYVIICYRYIKSWKQQFVPNMNYWIGSGGGVSVLVGVKKFKYNDKITISSDGFHMNTVGAKYPESFRRLFQHELGHELLSCPHHFGAGGALGRYFYSTTSGWGTSVGGESMNRLINAWERWLLGWIEIKHDLADKTDNGIYYLDDFATTGDVIRIKIPHSKNEYLWIENHQKKTIFDQSRWAGQLENVSIGSSGMPDIEKGLYMYTEKIMDEREKINTFIVSDMQRVNGMRLLHAAGNWDYEVPTEVTKTWDEYWNNTMYHFKRKEANPLSGINPFLRYRFDADGDKKIKNKHNFNGGSTESFKIVKEVVGDSTFLFFANHGGRNKEAKRHRRSDAFQLGDTLSINHNPPIINNPKYIPSAGMNAPVVINGLRVAVIGLENGKYKIKVDYGKTKVTTDLRIAGNILLKEIDGEDIDLEITEGVKITIDKSGTINSLNYLGGSFINETIFTLESSFLKLDKRAIMEIKDSSITLIKPDSKLELDANTKLKVLDKSTLAISKGATIILDPSSKITCSEKASIKCQAGSFINGIEMKQDFEFPKNRECNGHQILNRIKKYNK